MMTFLPLHYTSYHHPQSQLRFDSFRFDIVNFLMAIIEFRYRSLFYIYSIYKLRYFV